VFQTHNSGIKIKEERLRPAVYTEKSEIRVTRRVAASRHARVMKRFINASWSMDRQESIGGIVNLISQDSGPLLAWIKILVNVFSMVKNRADSGDKIVGGGRQKTKRVA
jgi:hypothetical protein